MYLFFCEHLYNFVKLLFYMYVSDIVWKFVSTKEELIL